MAEVGEPYFTLHYFILLGKVENILEYVVHVLSLVNKPIIVDI